MRRLAFSLLLLSVPALAEVGWRGDFETGDLSQYPHQQLVSGERAQIVESPVYEGRYALRVSVQQGDDPINSSGNRSELAGEELPEGTEVYYRWATRFDPSFPSAEAFQVFAQWHHPESNGPPPIAFEVIGEEIMLFLNGWEGLVWQTPLVRDTWHEFILHVKFSDDPKVGFIELWYGGQKVLEKTYSATRANAYLKLGLYRNESIGPEGIVFHDGMIRADSLEEVLPQAPLPPAPPPELEPAPGEHVDPPGQPVTEPLSAAPTPVGCTAGGLPLVGPGGLASLLLIARSLRRRNSDRR